MIKLHIQRGDHPHPITIFDVFEHENVTMISVQTPDCDICQFGNKIVFTSGVTSTMIVDGLEFDEFTYTRYSHGYYLYFIKVPNYLSTKSEYRVKVTR